MMKGNAKNAVLLVILVVVLLFIITSIIGMIQALTGKKGLYERMANPLVFTAEEVVTYGSEKFVNTCENFMNEVETIFVYDEVERECSRWYSNCVESEENPPQNPWTKPEILEKDLETMKYLKPDCRTPGIDRLREKWADKSPNFAKKNEFEQYNLIRNACGSTLVKRIYD